MVFRQLDRDPSAHVRPVGECDLKPPCPRRGHSRRVFGRGRARNGERHCPRFRDEQDRRSVVLRAERKESFGAIQHVERGFRAGMLRHPLHHVDLTLAPAARCQQQRCGHGDARHGKAAAHRPLHCTDRGAWLPHAIVSIMLIAFNLLALALIIVAGSAWRRRYRVSSLVGFLGAGLCVTLALLCGAITVGIRGYRALTQEVVAATIKTEPIAPQRFRATVTLPDGSLHMFDLAGDAVYVDAHVLKWRPLATMLGLQTAYELDRIAGRYHTLTDEQNRERTVYSLAASKPFDAFDLAHRYWALRPFVDAEYGSARFTGGGGGGATPQNGGTYEVRVSTTGLLVRPVQPR